MKILNKISKKVQWTDMEEKLISVCGIDCGECPARIATMEDDVAKLAEVAKQWTTDDMPLNAEDVVCDSCHGPRLFKWCTQCPTRACAVEKGNHTCADCEEYPCDKLNESWKMLGESAETFKANLDEIRGRRA